MTETEIGNVVLWVMVGVAAVVWRLRGLWSRGGPRTRRARLAMGRALGLAVGADGMTGRIGACDVEVLDGGTGWASVRCRGDAMPRDLRIEGDRFDERVVSAASGIAGGIVRGATPEEREMLATAVRTGWKCADGVWLKASAGPEPSRIEEAVRTGVRLVEVVERLAREAPRRLSQRAWDGVTVEARVGALEALVTTHRLERACEEALATALKSDVPALRLVAARVLREPEVISELAQEGDDAVAVPAIEAMREFREIEIVRNVMAALVGKMANSSPAHRRAIAAALADVPYAAAEAALVELLSDDDKDVVRAAMTSLGAVGSIGVVAALGSFADRTLGGALKTTAREAIARIQERAGNPDAGRLGLADEAADGGLAVVGEGDVGDVERLDAAR